MSRSAIVVVVLLAMISVALQVGRSAAQESDTAAPSPDVVGERMPQRWALLVGIDDYAELDDLASPATAVNELQGRLIASGFPVANVFALRDGSRAAKYLPSGANVTRQLELVCALPDTKDVLLVVLCGRVAIRDGSSYFCPLDASRDGDTETLVDMRNLLRNIVSSKAEHKLLVLDITGVTDDNAEAVDRILSAVQRPPAGVGVLTCCQPGQSSRRGDSFAWTAFMDALIRGWEGTADQQDGDKDGATTLGELAAFVAKETGSGDSADADEEQTPTLYGKLPTDLQLGVVAQYSVKESAYPTIEDDDLGTASARLEAISRLNPRSLKAYNRALAAYGHGDLIETINLGSDALQYDRGNTWAHILRASAYATYGDLVAAVEDYRQLGIPLPCFVAVQKAEVRKGQTVIATVRQGDKLYATKANGDFLLVQVKQADGEVKEGWIHQKNLE